MTQRILTAVIGNELDVVGARQRARQIAALCGFGVQDQVRIATAVSELARNVWNYAGTGKIHFAIEGSTAPQVFADPHRRPWPRHRPARPHPGRPVRVANRHGPGHPGRAPPDGPLPYP